MIPRYSICLRPHPGRDARATLFNQRLLGSTFAFCPCFSGVSDMLKETLRKALRARLILTITNVH